MMSPKGGFKVIGATEAKSSLARSVKELAKQQEFERLQKHFSEVLKQWPTLNKKAKIAHLKRAEKNNCGEKSPVYLEKRGKI